MQRKEWVAFLKTMQKLNNEGRAEEAWAMVDKTIEECMNSIPKRPSVEKPAAQPL